jgi:indole-3-glycerol phosphate synthase
LGATLIGVNNRNPYNNEVSLDVSVEVARAAPKDVLLVSENGLRTGKQLRGLRALGYSGFLIGEALMRGGSPDKTLKELLQSKET